MDNSAQYPEADSLADALKSLPHGPEFRFIDRLTELTPGLRGQGEYLVRGDEPFLRGHFPGQPLFPGVLLVEAAAQLSGTIAQSDPSMPFLLNMKLTALRSVKILGSATPGQLIQFDAEIILRFGNLIHARARASVNDQVILNAELTLSGDAPH